MHFTSHGGDLLGPTVAEGSLARVRATIATLAFQADEQFVGYAFVEASLHTEGGAAFATRQLIFVPERPKCNLTIEADDVIQVPFERTPLRVSLVAVRAVSREPNKRHQSLPAPM